MLEPSPSAAATRVRYLVVFLATLMATLLYLDRYCIAILERFIKEDLRLSESEMAVFLSVFFYTYALAQVPSGWLTDRFGARLMLTVYILGWSLFTGVTGIVYGFVSLLVVRGLFGMMQAGAYPTAASVLSKWMPLEARGTASGIVSFGGRIGGTIAPILSGFLMVLFVPITESSRIGEADILDHLELTRQIQNLPKPAKPGEKPKATSAPNEQDLAIAELRSLLFAACSPELQQKIPVVWEEKPTNLDSATARELLDVLNRAIEQKSFFDAESVALVSLPRQGAAIRKKSEGERSDDESMRLNRLVLEQLFPGSVLQVYAPSWRPVLIIYGSIGLIVAGAFWWLYRDSPAEHPRCNAAEGDLIRGLSAATTPGAPKPAGAIPWERILGSRSLWCNSLLQFGTNIGWVFIVIYMPRYLSEVHRVPLGDRAFMTSLPMLFGIAGNFLGGWLTDYTTRKLGLRWGRALPIAVTRFLCAAAYVACLWSDSPWMFTVLMCLMAFNTDLGIASTWAFSQDIGGRFVGSILGWANMWGNFGAAIAPVLLNYVIETYSWESMFLTCAGSFALAGVLAFGVDATDKVD